jgi:hypothetical protein
MKTEEGGRERERAGGLRRRAGSLRPALCRILPLYPVLLALALPASAQQDTVNVIDPAAPPAQGPWRSGAPIEAVQEAVARYNDSTATRLYGSFTVGSGTTIRGDVGMYRGTLRVNGRVVGRVTILNGALIIGPEGVVEGEVLLIGGRFLTQPGGTHTGPMRTYADPAPVIRTPAGLLEIREEPLGLGDLARARATFTAGKVSTELVLETGRTYNRVEGLPLIAGPTFRFPTPNDGEAKVDLRGILRTESDPTDQRAEFGFRTRFEWQKKSGMRYGIGATWAQEVVPIEDQPFSLAEIGWSTFLLGRDYRDYFQDQAAGGYVFAYPFRPLRAEAGIDYRKQSTVPASDPVNLANPNPWRPNPLVDDGHYTVFRGALEYDTRNATRTPTSGWYARANLERQTSSDVAPLALPAEVREPLPTGRSYSFYKLWVDLRTYARINTWARVNLRLAGGGWIGGDPLPVQERVALGGYDVLPGYQFRDQRCAPAGYTDPALTALCDRSLSVQTELRYRFRLGLREWLGSGEWVLLERLIGADQADVVLFGDMGKAWLTGEGPGRVPNNRIPKLGEWAYDVGAGIDFDGLAVYVAAPLTGQFEPRLTFRLQRRF